MKRTLAVILVIGGLVVVVLGTIISAPDGAGIKYGAMVGGLVLAGLGVGLYRSTIKPEPIRRTRDYKEPGKLDLDAESRSSSAKPSSEPAQGDPKPTKSKRFDL
jgi:hypothetical protein